MFEVHLSTLIPGIASLILGAMVASGCTSAAPTPETPVITAESVELELIDSLKASAAEIHQAAQVLESSTAHPTQREQATTTLLQITQSLLNNTKIVQGCAKWIRYQEYGLGASFAKHECETHYERERLAQLHDALNVLTWHPTERAGNLAKAVVQDARTSTSVRGAAITLLEALAILDPIMATEASIARRELAARERFRADNLATLAQLSDNLKLCFSGRDRDLDLIFELNPQGDVVRVHSPQPASRVEDCVISYALDEVFAMRGTAQNLVFRIHVAYRSNI